MQPSWNEQRCVHYGRNESTGSILKNPGIICVEIAVLKLREREKEEKIEMVRDMIAMLSDVNLFSTVMRLGLALLLGEF